MQTNQYLKQLLLGHIKGTISETGRQTLFSSLADDGLAEEWKLVIKELSSEVQISKPYNDEEWESMIQGILKPENKVAPVHRIHLLRKAWFRYAAAVIILVSIGVVTAIVLSPKPHTSAADGTVAQNNDVKAPVSNKAMITLADGRRVSLDSLNKGLLAEQGSIKLVKFADGQIAYQASNGGIVKDVQYNTLSNPRGSKVIDLTLADGSRVWLNAGSSVTYPIAFIGNERKVEITGEAYFEITHDVSKPFVVNKGETSVQVLGTKFNVNAYDDETDIKITLLEGSVKVSNDAGSKTIKPGEQAVVTLSGAEGSHSPLTIHHAPDVEQVMAWKNGQFYFDKADIKTIMKEVSRWYGVDVIYTADVKPKFYLKARRNTSVSSIFKILETTGGVNLEIEGNKIIVKP